MVVASRNKLESLLLFVALLKVIKTDEISSNVDLSKITKISQFETIGYFFPFFRLT
jgi:hypothetical protein